ncbi:MAG: tetratricopeptide repeat protein [Planctomycetota bacterium]
MHVLKLMGPAMIGAAVLLGGCATGPDVTMPGPEQIQQRKAEAVALMGKGGRLAERGDTEGAIEAYQQAVVLDRSLGAAWNNLGELMLREERYADAVGAFTAAADADPADPRPVYNAALAYQRIGWAADAYDQYTRALERDENFLPALRGAVRSGEMLSKADPVLAEQVRRAMLLETDATWRSYLERQRFRIEAGMDATLRDANG